LNETVEKSSASTIEKLESIERVVKEDLNLLYDENRRIEENLTRTESNISDAVEKSAIKVVEHLDGFETTLKDEMVVLQKGNDHIRETLAESQNVLNETVEKSSASTIEKLESIERVVKEDLNLLYDENRRMKVDLQTTIVETVERSNLAVKYELNTLIDSSKQINEFLLSRESQLNSTISKMQKKIEILNEQKAFSEKKYREIFENIEQIQKSKKKFQRLHSDVIQREQKIKNHLSYRIGYAIVSNLKSPLNWIKIPYAIFQAFQAFKLNNNAPESAYIDLITQNPNDCIIMPMSKWQVFQIPSYNSAIFLSLLSFDKSDYIELEWSIQENNDILEQNVTNFSSDNVKRIPIQESDNHDCQLLLRKRSGKPCLIKIHSKPMLLEVNDNIQKPSVVHEQITTIGENESLPAPTLSIVPYMQRLKEFGKTLEIVYTGEPLISVIMTSYNTEDYIAAAIESILNQTWISLELIVVDDCSTDQSRIVIENIMKNDKRVKLYCFGENRGTYWCKNYGITKAQGDIITFMDSDDVSLPDRLSLQFQELNHPDRVMVTCNLIRKNLEGDILSINGITERIAPISKMVKKSVFDDIGYFDTLRTSADDEFMQRIRLAYGRNAHANVQQVLYHALVRDESLTMEAGNAIDLTAKREAGKSFLPPARQNYLESYQLWHKTLAEQGMIPYMPFPVVSRAFPVYGKLVVSRGQYDGNTISICMASFPPREEVMKQTVLSLIDQVDYIYVYLNNYIAIPDCLDHPRIKVTLGINADGDLRDNGKLYFMQNIADGYCFFVDDDIAYPADYVQQLIRKIEFYDRKAVVGIHGTIFAKPFESYFKGRTLYHFRDELQRDAVVNQLGTGTVGFHTGLIRPNLKHFSETGMADVFFAIEMKKNNIPLICIERKKGWLQPINVNVADGANLFEEFRNNDHKQTQLISENGPFDEMISNELGETLRANEQKYGLSFASHSIDISILRL
jgi:glycosyltransferase involved in cell wall biosynthesis